MKIQVLDPTNTEKQTHTHKHAGAQYPQAAFMFVQSHWVETGFSRFQLKVSELLVLLLLNTQITM